MTEKRYSRTYDFSKSLIDEITWNTMRCKKCGEKLPNYPSYTDYGELKICRKCGNRHLLVRRLPKNG